MQLRWELGSPVFGLLLRKYAPHDTYEVRPRPCPGGCVQEWHCLWMYLDGKATGAGTHDGQPTQSNQFFATEGGVPVCFCPHHAAVRVRVSRQAVSTRLCPDPTMYPGCCMQATRSAQWAKRGTRACRHPIKSYKHPTLCGSAARAHAHTLLGHLHTPY